MVIILPYLQVAWPLNGNTLHSAFHTMVDGIVLCYRWFFFTPWNLYFYNP